MKCSRCGREVRGLSMSYFNTQDICDKCTTKEESHPKYKEARTAESAAIQSGIYNFNGIGLPSELR